MSSHSHTPRVRSRFSWLGKKITVPTILEPMMSVESIKNMDISRIIHAYEVAERLHRGVNRKSGEPYITHPVAVATILSELGLDEDTIVAALLHDTVEDTEYTLEELSAEFTNCCSPS